MTAVIIPETNGLSTHSNDLAAPVGSTSVADNVVFSREGRPERRTGFKDYSTNIPDFEPQQLIASAAGDQAYMHLDGGIWYSSSGTWYRKRGAFGTSLNDPVYCEYLAGHLYVTTADHVIYDINLSTGTRTILAGRYGVPNSTDGTGGAARFSSPMGICTDGTNLFVCDSGNSTVRQIVIATGVVTTLAGTAGSSGGTDGTGSAARFGSGIRGICTDGTNLYLCDSSRYTVRKIVISSAVVTTLAGTTTAQGTTDATGSAARFRSPYSIDTDNTNLYVGDEYVIRKIVISSAVVTTIAGSAGVSGTTDATGTSARFSLIWGLRVVGANIYICDTTNCTIRKMVISTLVVTTPIGTAGSSDSIDGIGASARLAQPQDIVDDGTDLYVMDYGKDLVRKVYVASLYVSTIDGVSGVNASSTGLPLANGIFVGPD